MTAWDAMELRRIGAATELRISSRRPDGTLRPAVTIWHAAVGDALYIRSAHGPENGWFRRALRSGTGRVTAGGVSKDVTFEPADEAVAPAVDAALHAKYDRYGPGPVGAITGTDAASTTLLVMPA
ncbi:DUF2255 family protein [Microbacterium trichothecenolyticum]|uniref:DUF2255 family protein n=1 Tax=Microbacterium trichothecenolyticum TaxID=69370 RepID=A0A0M2HAR3_MICTR|nr:DUF2255 family protein [Microbacterium trichothecenolyticum]KJL43682.1 hypothetical protein RS82_01378 [Microbacterium trichothecenolyticum]